MRVEEVMRVEEARRIALSAQGLDRPRPARKITISDVRRTIHRLGLLQLDFVNVLVPAHYQILFSRLGSYDRRLLDTLVSRNREFTEQWAHEASIVPMDAWPLLRHRRETFRIRPHFFESFMAEHSGYAAKVLSQVEAQGPLAAEGLPDPEGLPGDAKVSWYSSLPRAVLEAHFGRGLLAVTERKTNMARLYDLAHRVIPAAFFDQRIAREDADRELLDRAARAHGIATAADLADYYRMSPKDSRPRIAELVEMGRLKPVTVEKWRDPAYLHIEAKTPRAVTGATLLSPFDPLVWFRPRAERLFDFHYRIEIYTPEAKRKWGYYVLPFLLHDRIAARVDLKADRANSTLVALATHLEPHAEKKAVMPALRAELRAWADWLGLENISVDGRRSVLA